MSRFILFICLSLTWFSSLFGGYKFEEIEVPAHVDSQVGGLATLPNGDIAACFHRGEVMIYNIASKTWRLFADGLHEPLGVVALDDHRLMIMQRPELTLLIDTDKDGVADDYQTFYDGFGMTGNYHEFAFGPTVDKEGNYYIALNVASNGASIRKEIRGEWLNIGWDREKFYSNEKDYWKKNKKHAGRMYSRVPFRGWVLKITPEGDMTPISCGVRSPNGLGFDAKGNLFVPDNQGDWLGTSKVHWIRKGHFHGHPSSLVWRKDWDGRDPLDVSVKELDKMRSKAAALSPQGIMANSITQPLLIDGDQFGPYKGQMLIGEMNFPKVLRFIQDEVQGEVQGALLAHLENGPMKIGNNRLTWAKDGSLFIGRTKLSWAGFRGISRVTWDGELDFDIQNCQLTKSGFDLTFTKDFAMPKDVNFTIKSYYYIYQEAYGSPRMDEKELKVTHLKKRGNTLSIELEGLQEGRVIDFYFEGLKSTKGESLKAHRMCYTLNKMK